MAERRRPRHDLDERFKIETDDPEDTLRRLLGVEVPIDEEDSTEDENP